MAHDLGVIKDNSHRVEAELRVCEAFNELFDKTRLALSKSDEAEYWRIKIDQAQERIFGPDYLHWQERYSYWDERDTY